MVKIKRVGAKKITHEQRVLNSARKTFKALYNGKKVHADTIRYQILRIERRLDFSADEQLTRARRKRAHVQRLAARNQLDEESDWDDSLTETDESFLSDIDDEGFNDSSDDDSFNDRGNNGQGSALTGINVESR